MTDMSSEPRRRQRRFCLTFLLLLIGVATILSGCESNRSQNQRQNEVSNDRAAIKRVLILCTGNSCRSQMAEAVWNDLGKGEWHAFSAGVEPAGYIHPLAIQVMSELGLDISENRSKHLHEFHDEPFDLVITVCDNARQSCPVLPGAKQVLHWPFDDPADAKGTPDEKLMVFRSARDKIRARIVDYLEEIQQTKTGDLREL